MKRYNIVTNRIEEILYSLSNDEVLADNIGDIIEHYLTNVYDVETNGEIDNNTTLDIIECKRDKANYKTGPLLDKILSDLDSIYGASYGETKPTHAMKAAEKLFIDTVLKDYVPYMCLPTGKKVTIKLKEWIEKNKFQTFQPQDIFEDCDADTVRYRQGV